MQLTNIYTAAALALPHLAAAVTCEKGAHVIVARATTEPQGEGIIGAVAANVTKLIPDSDSVAVVYPATFQYLTSEAEGVGNMTKLVKEYGDACPDSKMVLMGYSQGAQVVGDTLVGTDEDIFSNPANPVPAPLATKYLNQIVAIIMMGDPAHNSNTTFNVGNATGHGLFPRNNSMLFDTLDLTPKMQSYCDHNDKYCDSGNSSYVHASYTRVYGEAATKFVVDKFNAAAASISNSTSTNGTYTSASPSASGTASSGATGTGAKASGSAASTAPASAAATSVMQGSMSYIMTGVLSSALVVALYL